MRKLAILFFAMVISTIAFGQSNPPPPAAGGCGTKGYLYSGSGGNGCDGGTVGAVSGPAGILNWSVVSGVATASPASVLDDALMSGPPVGSFLTPVPTGNYCTFFGNFTGNFTTTCTLPAATAAGNLIHVWSTQNNSGGSCTLIAPTDGTNTYTQIQFYGGFTTSSYYAKNIAGGSVTITFTGSGCSGSSGAWGGALEITNVDTSSPLDQHGSNNWSGGTGMYSTGTVTTTFAPAIIIGTVTDGSNDSLSGVVGWSVAVPETSNSSPASAVIAVYQTSSTAGVYSPQFLCTGANCNGQGALGAQTTSYKGRATSGASGSWSAQYLRFSQLCPVAFPGLCGLIPSSTQGTTGLDLHVGTPIEAIAQTSAYSGTGAGSTLVTTQASGLSSYHCWVYVSCHTTVASATIIPQLLFTNPRGTAITLTGDTATCTTAGTSDTSTQAWPVYTHAASTIFLKTILANSPSYDVHAVCSIANTQ